MAYYRAVTDPSVFLNGGPWTATIGTYLVRGDTLGTRHMTWDAARGMQPTALVRRGVRPGQPGDERENPTKQTPYVISPERRPSKQLHDQGVHAIRLFEAVHLRDVRMVQGSEDPRLTVEPRSVQDPRRAPRHVTAELCRRLNDHGKFMHLEAASYWRCAPALA